MAQYRMISLYSGSSGNAFLLITPGARILIDAGKNARALTRALDEAGCPVETVNAILITHDHHDHTSALAVLLKHHPVPVHVVEASAQVIARGAPQYLTDCLRRHTPLFCEAVGDVTVRSFITPHDSEFSVGYRMEFTDEAGVVHTVGYATDLGYVTEDVRAALLGCESVVLECNHDKDMLLTGPYPYHLKERILSRYGHLSNDDCAAFAGELIEGGTEHLMLAHLSEQNNDPTLAYNEVLTAIGRDDVDLCVAAPDHVVELPTAVSNKWEELPLC
ncbi:MAG: MBL fold metallo-hydrolase [Ruminococcaceae bacterium]|nr:MBL fold metallo-hydrolase [Oscillospiraceae bacterium]